MTEAERELLIWQAEMMQHYLVDYGMDTSAAYGASLLARVQSERARPMVERSFPGASEPRP